MRLIHGGCQHELPKIKGDFIIVTDPPFNREYHYSGYKDALSEGEYYGMLREVFSYGPFVVIHYPENIYRIASEVDQLPTKVVSWVYNSNTTKQHRDIALSGVKPDFTKAGQPYKNPTDKRIQKRIAEGKMARLYDWWNINQVKNVSKTHSHPCVMPEEVMENIIKILPNTTIVDPFMGTGTTGVARKRLGRDFVGIELVKEYFDIAVERIKTAH